MLSRFETDSGLEFRTSLDLSAIILGATTSDYTSLSGRDYDYGPGVTAGFSAEFITGGHEFLTVSHEQHFIHTVNGNRSDHHISISTARATVPLHNNWSVGAEYQLMLGERLYKDFEDVSVRRPELRFFATSLLR